MQDWKYIARDEPADLYRNRGTLYTKYDKTDQKFKEKKQKKPKEHKVLFSLCSVVFSPIDLYCNYP